MKKHPYHVIQEVAETSSRNKKIQILKDNESFDMMYILEMTYDTRYNYFVRDPFKNVAPQGNGTNRLGEVFSWLIHEVATRNVSGNALREQILEFYHGLSELDAKVLSLVVNRDVRAGISVKTIKAVYPTIRIFEYPYMRCSTFKAKEVRKNIRWPAAIELKADGTYVNVALSDDAIDVFTRNGSRIPLNCLPNAFVSALNALIVEGAVGEGIVLNGELLSFTNGVVDAREVGNGLINSMIAGNPFPEGKELRMQVWDVIPEISFFNGICDITRQERMLCLETILHRDKFASLRYTNVIPDSLFMVPHRVVNNINEAIEFYEEMLEQGEEGAILKDLNAIWKHGTSKQQVKMKLAIDVELKIVGYKEGKGKFEGNLGSLQLASSDGKVQVSSSGFKDAVRKKLWKDRDNLAGKIVTIRSNGLMKPNNDGKQSLFLPRFIELRNDKTEADDLSYIQKAEKMSKDLFLKHE